MAAGVSPDPGILRVSDMDPFNLVANAMRIISQRAACDGTQPLWDRMPARNGISRGGPLAEANRGSR